jgi:hypothetical protein
VWVYNPGLTLPSDQTAGFVMGDWNGSSGGDSLLDAIDLVTPFTAYGVNDPDGRGDLDR